MESETIELSFVEMKICGHCGEIFGRVGVSGEPGGFWQTCECGRTPAGIQVRSDLRAYLNLDFSQVVTLCCGCGRELVQSGSAWAPLFCECCLMLVRQSNPPDPFSPWRIPIGRHSVMNGISLSGTDAQDDQKVGRFVQAVNSLQERIEHLERWKKLVITRNREEAGFWGDGDVELAVYLEAVSRDKLAKHKAIAPLWSFFAGKFGPPFERENDVQPAEETARPSANQDVDDERILYTSEKEIRCVFYALIVRTHALAAKYMGGLMGYLKRHGGEYNDGIATLCYMGPEWDSDVADLESNGLQRSEDFIVLVDDLYGPPSCHEDFEVYPFDVASLQGYYHQGGIVVSMVS
jgi:hypothetical protein